VTLFAFGALAAIAIAALAVLAAASIAVALYARRTWRATERGEAARQEIALEQLRSVLSQEAMVSELTHHEEEEKTLGRLH
jgi:hypothetical protein